MYITGRWVTLSQQQTLDTHLSEGYLCRVDDVRAIPPKNRVNLVLNHKHYVGGNVGRRLVSLFGKGNLGPLLPAPFDVHGEDLVFGAHGAAVRVQPLARDLHLLGATREHFFQAHFELVHYWRIFLLFSGPVRTAWPRLEGSGKSAHSSHSEGCKGVVNVHVIIYTASGCKKLIKRATATKELCKDGVRITMKSIAGAVGAASGMSFEPCGKKQMTFVGNSKSTLREI